MIASPRENALSFDFHLSPGELSPVNDQATFHAAMSAATVADFALEVEEQAFYRQNEEWVWCSLGTWDI